MSEEKKEVAVSSASASERFQLAVEKEFGSGVGKVELTSFQRKLIQNYFIKLDRSLKEAETKRMQSQKESLAITWANVNMAKLSQDIVALSSVGLDPLQPNHINLIPYKNNSANNYDIVGIIGYRGLELKAKKYGLEIPIDVIIEVVYSTDKFTPIKKSATNRSESYQFEITNAFSRGEIIGGFWYMVFQDATKNRLKIFSMADINKRKPKYASAEFWGGEKAIYKGGQKTKETEKIEGWLDEMVYKTIARNAYNSITIDSEKIDEHLTAVMSIEASENTYFNQNSVEETVATEIQENANTKAIDFEVEVKETPEEAKAEAPKPEF